MTKRERILQNLDRLKADAIAMQNMSMIEYLGGGVQITRNSQPLLMSYALNRLVEIVEDLVQEIDDTRYYHR